MENITGSDGERDGKGVTRPTSQSFFFFFFKELFYHY